MKKSELRKYISEALTPDEASKVEPKYKETYAAMIRGKGPLKLKKYDLPLPEYYGTNGYYPGNWDRVKEIVEPAMEKVILDAAKEQGIKLELVPSATTGKIELEAA